MSRRFVTDLKDGDIVEEVFLVSDKQLRANRNAALYLSVDLRDRTGLINGVYCRGCGLGNEEEKVSVLQETPSGVKIRSTGFPSLSYGMSLAGSTREITPLFP